MSVLSLDDEYCFFLFCLYLSLLLDLLSLCRLSELLLRSREESELELEVE